MSVMFHSLFQLCFKVVLVVNDRQTAGACMGVVLAEHKLIMNHKNGFICTD